MIQTMGAKQSYSKTATNTNLTLPQQLNRMDSDRLRAYRENLDFYNGSQWQGRSRGRERRLTFNYAKTVVDKVTSYLMSGLSFAIEPGSSQDADAARRAERTLHEVHDANNLEQLDFDTELDTAILGDGCYKVTWDARENRVRVVSAGCPGHLRLVAGRRRQSHLAGCQPLPAFQRRGGLPLRRDDPTGHCCAGQTPVHRG